ncbi:enoyl-CoA hydratase [Rhodospirillum rubrum]|uniref:Enoyl-CoA hydratase domain-containing protein 3, mitochondrial n=1 Tax=Rhodospirillum rubrum (strain ATCC 11170 / ATH 1.1.1 / DSM 467 / LMG 4362 / NCIMB 8255 / S1) TaxID=269796 RepID=Q2RSD9_RHORT|nr:enoyl-CoA hydratase [Rhodospirillum rubrum]ABC22956.1 short chain enoyl-CoA hydratase [Rhodospirillum rubrum ATCC 11170]AEO48686.1 enoyl-CoA hydratase [Rhodospirillum rubrum F11]MBK5954581.1 enoyl-CoA hydratase [Rhodospirillum rubrum]QXG78942.1 enoyl-CoA hydratase [Rhodospirillum rubrum]HCF19000.1 enoyl-CoA hydratase [Rhodospirillum rubrum]
MTVPPPLLESLTVDGVRTLTLNRPQARNALSKALMAALQDALDQAAEDPAVRVVVIAASGPVFCAGHDLRELRGEPNEAAHAALFAQCSRLMTTIVRLPKPVIARVQGLATAAGCQLVASCDLAVAARRASFATPGVTIGLFCSTPMVALSRAVGRKTAMEMLLTGRPLDAEEALARGLITQVVEEAELAAATDALARILAEKSPLTLAIGKEAFYQQIELPLDEAYAYASAVMTRNMQTKDAAEGIDAFLEKRPPRWTGQ